MARHPRSRADFDPRLLAILAARLEAIGREMTNTVMKASRSAVIKNSRDFSCGLLTWDHRLLSVEDGIPVHVAALDMTSRPLTELFDDIRPGDAFVNNSPYMGGTHHADITVCVPVFCDGAPMFWALVRAHHADIGAPSPSTYLPFARTIYEEGLHLPCLRVQRDYVDDPQFIRLCRMKIRVADLWYGDFQAQLGACHVAERRLQDMVRCFGRAEVLAFVEAWMSYGERRAIAEIRKLPKGTWRYETAHDPVPGIADGGIPVRVTVTVDPARGLVTVDARDNVDCIPGGLNLSEACATGACRIGVYNNLAADVPHNEGSASRIRVLLRDGCVVGRPTYPIGTSVATTNVNSRLITAVSCCFAAMGRPFGMGEIAYSQALGEAVISGRDARRGRDYVNQIFVGYGGGPGVEGHDGWLLNGAACDGGQMALDSVEIDEGMYPMVIERRRVAEDSLGPGQWDGAPGVEGAYRPLDGALLAIYGSDGDVGAPRGVAGGGAARPSFNGKRGRDGRVRALPAFHEETCAPDEALVFRSCGGGGYGDPFTRDPARVAAAVNRSWLSVRRAAEAYGVVVRRDAVGDWIVDAAATRLRRSRRKAGARPSRAKAATGSL